MLKGSCLCGGVHYQIEAELGPVYFCHCSKCRKASGSAFAAATLVKPADFELLSGQELLNEFESSEGVFRVFCRRCASHLYSRRTDPSELLRLRVGSLDTPIEKVDVSHIFVDSKARWFDICDNRPQYAERPVL